MLTYDKYENLCNAMTSLDLKPDRMPTREEMDIITSRPQFLSICIWLLEKDECIPDTEEGEQCREYLNDRMYDLLESDKTTGEDEKGILYADYAYLFTVSRNLSFIPKDWFPSIKEIDEIFIPNVKYQLGFILALLLSHEDLSDTEAYKHLCKMTEKNISIKEKNRTARINIEKYKKLLFNLSEIAYDPEGWWPSKYDVEHIIKPNMVVCYDFVIWLIKYGIVKNSNDEKVKEMLEKLARDYISIADHDSQLPTVIS